MIATILSYLIPFILTMLICYQGERKTKVDPSRDKDEFEGRMLILFLGILIFIILHIGINHVTK